MTLQEEVQAILNVKYPKLRAEAKVRDGCDGVWISINLSNTKWLGRMDRIRDILRESLGEMKQILESDLEEINR